jgi:hypothetical protein
MLCVRWCRDQGKIDPQHAHFRAGWPTRILSFTLFALNLDRRVDQQIPLRLGAASSSGVMERAFGPAPQSQQNHQRWREGAAHDVPRTVTVTMGLGAAPTVRARERLTSLIPLAYAEELRTRMRGLADSRRNLQRARREPEEAIHRSWDLQRLHETKACPIQLSCRPQKAALRILRRGLPGRQRELNCLRARMLEALRTRVQLHIGGGRDGGMCEPGQ